MKILTFISLMLFSVRVHVAAVHPPEPLKRILASAVRISPTKNKNGSGNVISKNGKDYVLTNAHVCLPSSNMLDNPHLVNKQKNKEFTYTIQSFYETLTFKLKLKELKYDGYNDICLIPLPKDHKFQAIEYPNKIPPIKEKENYFFVNFNTKAGHIKTEELFNKDNYFVSAAPIEYKANKDKYVKRMRGEYYRLDGLVIAGDSGSLVFNNDFELIGQVFGSNYNPKDPQGSMIEKKILDSIFNETIQRAPSDIKELSEIY